MTAPGLSSVDNRVMIRYNILTVTESLRERREAGGKYDSTYDT